LLRSFALLRIQFGMEKDCLGEGSRELPAAGPPAHLPLSLLSLSLPSLSPQLSHSSLLSLLQKWKDETSPTTPHTTGHQENRRGERIGKFMRLGLCGWREAKRKPGTKRFLSPFNPPHFHLGKLSKGQWMVLGFIHFHSASPFLLRKTPIKLVILQAEFPVC